MKILQAAIIAATVGFAPFAASTASAGTLVGDTVACVRNGEACSGVSTAVVGAGVEFTRPSTFDFDATGVTLTMLPGGGYTSPLIYSFTDLTHPFTGISSVTLGGVSSFTPGAVTFNNGVLSFDLSAGTYNSGATIRVNLNTAVPEPATWAMMIMGFGLMGATLRSRKTKVAFA